MSKARTPIKNFVMVPLDRYKAVFCKNCDDREWCNKDKLNRSECLMSALYFALTDVSRVITESELT